MPATTFHSSLTALFLPPHPPEEEEEEEEVDDNKTMMGLKRMMLMMHHPRSKLDISHLLVPPLASFNPNKRMQQIAAVVKNEYHT